MKQRRLITRLLFWMLFTTNTFAQEVCDLPHLPVRERINNRTFPSLFAAWEGFRVVNMPELSETEHFALHDLFWHGPPFNVSFVDVGNTSEIRGNIIYAEKERDAIRQRNRNVLALTGMLIRNSPPDGFPEDWPYWLRDDEGNRVFSPSGQVALIDFTLPGLQDIIVERAVAAAKCGLFDGIFIDWFTEDFTVLLGHKTLEEEQQAKDTILKRIRASVRDDFLIIANYNRGKMFRRAWGINGSFMETGRDDDKGYTRKGIKEIEDTLLWLETNLREPRINCLEGWGITTEPPESPNNRRWMRLFTTMSLTCSDGYVLYNLDNYHRHIWYNFWDADLGRPIGAKGQPHQNIEGLYIREFTNGWAVYNRSGKEQPITLPRASTGVSSDKTDITHLLPDLDGEIYLRIGKPFDINRDGIVNILDLILVSQYFGTTEGDTNGDGTTNILDLTLIAQQFSQ